MNNLNLSDTFCAYARTFSFLGPDAETDLHHLRPNETHFLACCCVWPSSLLLACACLSAHNGRPLDLIQFIPTQRAQVAPAKYRLSLSLALARRVGPPNRQLEGVGAKLVSLCDISLASYNWQAASSRTQIGANRHKSAQLLVVVPDRWQWRHTHTHKHTGRDTIAKGAR